MKSTHRSRLRRRKMSYSGPSYSGPALHSGSLIGGRAPKKYSRKWLESVRLSPFALAASGEGDPHPGNCCSNATLYIMPCPGPLQSSHKTDGPFTINSVPDCYITAYNNYKVTGVNPCGVTDKSGYFQYLLVDVHFSMSVGISGGSIYQRSATNFTLAVCLQNDKPGMSVRVCLVSGNPQPSDVQFSTGLLAGENATQLEDYGGNSHSYAPALNLSCYASMAGHGVNAGIDPLYFRGVWCK